MKVDGEMASNFRRHSARQVSVFDCDSSDCMKGVYCGVTTFDTYKASEC